ncbi:MAG: hypothetical protein Ta2D_03880 [Rickettsiales bacterium]|nr:MAG: hypothetical protein Ta2D_03880 [Rickettsiales bacterium]
MEIENPYSNDYKKTTEQAKKEIADGYKPKLKTKIKNIKKYSLIYLGSPIWWGTISTPVASFLSEYDLTGIDIISFVSHGGGGAGRSFDDIKKSTKGNLVSQLVYSGKTAEKK